MANHCFIGIVLRHLHSLNTPGHDIKIALDVAASELYNEEDGTYHFSGETELKRRNG